MIKVALRSAGNWRKTLLQNKNIQFSRVLVEVVEELSVELTGLAKLEFTLYYIVVKLKTKILSG